MKSNADSLLKNGYNIDMGLDGQILEYEVKLQHLERSAEYLTSSLRTISSVLHEKYHMGKESQSQNLDDVSPERNDAKLKDLILSELKAEALLTSLLCEKLYSKELAIEHLQSELAEAVRCNDILKSEVEHAMDYFACVNHKSKDLELLVMKKDEIINQLEGDLQACKKEVKQYKESNMLLNTEMNVMRKEIEALDDDILLKEGQINILKDGIGKPFDVIAGLGF